MYSDASSNGTPMDITTVTDIPGYRAPLMLTFLASFEVPPINLTCERFTTGSGLSASVFYFVNGITERCSAPFFTIAEFAVKETSSYEL